MGGDFDYVGPYEPNGTAVNTTTNQVDFTYARPNGQVLAALPDGAGGWYIAGTFTSIGNVTRNRLARINSNGTLNSWNPNVNNTVRCMVLNGPTLYIGGDFTTVNGQPRSRLAGVSTATGAPTSLNLIVNNTVNCMALQSSVLYFGGSFTLIGAATYNRIASVNLSTLSLLPFNPNADNTVIAMAVGGDKLFLSGIFTTVGGASRAGLASVYLTNGLAAPWNPTVTGTVNCLALSGTTAIIAGSFTAVNSTARSNIASLDTLGTGSLRSWNPSISGGAVNSILISGSTVYAGGAFKKAVSQYKHSLAAINTITGALTSFSVEAGGTVSALAINGPSLYAGGNFQSIGGVTRNRAAAFTISTKLITSWHPDCDNSVNAMVIDNGLVYLGGTFGTINAGIASGKLAAVDASTGLLSSFAPTGINGGVDHLVVAGGYLYLGGSFTSVNSSTRNRLAAFNISTGALDSWNPSMNLNVQALAADANKLYVGGVFTTVGGTTTRNRLAAFDLSTKTLTSWDPNSNAGIDALAAGGSTIFTGGGFTTIGGGSRTNFAALDNSAGLLTAMPSFSASSSVTVLVPPSGNNLYLGGSFTSFGGATRNRMAAIDLSTNTITGFNPDLNGDPNKILELSKTLYVGGGFTTVSGLNRPYFAVVSDAAAWYLDADNDGHYVSTQLATSSPGAGWTTTLPSGGLGDCNDNNNAIWQSNTVYLDADGDGYSASSTTLCYGATLPAGYSLTTNGADCNDNNNAIWQSNTVYLDADGDGYSTGSTTLCYGATLPAGYSLTTNGADCNDSNNAIWQSNTVYIDADGDGYTNGTTTLCYGATLPAGYSAITKGADCDDNSASTFNNCAGAGLECSGWSYSRPVTINATPTNYYQVSVQLTAGQYAHIQSNGNDLRFKDAAGNNCTYFIESWNTSGTSTIWVNVPVAGTTALTMYYGNATATSASDAEGTFDLYDDFSGSIVNLTKWNVKTGTTSSATLSGGELVLNPGTTDDQGSQLIAKQNFGYASGKIIETTLGTGGTTAATLCGSRASYCGASNLSGSTAFFPTDYTGTYSYACWSAGRNGVVTSACFNSGGSGTAYSANQPVVNAGEKVAVTIETGRVQYFKNGSTVYTSLSNTPASALYPILSYYRAPCQPNNGQTLKISDIRVRSYTTGYNASASVGAETTLNCITTWLGTTTQWTAPTNWSGNFVPNSCSHNVVIPSAPSGGLFPTIGLAAIQVGNLTIQDGATITVNNNPLSVCGTIDAGSATNAVIAGNAAGSLVLNGSGNQQLSGKLQVNTLHLNNGAGATLQAGAAYDIMNKVALQNGTLNTTAGILRFRSTSSSQIAILDDFSSGYSGSIIGDITAERAYDAASYQNAHYFGSPVSGPTAGSLGSTNGSGGFIIPQSGCDELYTAPGSPYGNVYSYDQSNASACSMAGWKVEASGTALTAAKGYSVRRTGAGVLSLTGSPNTDATYLPVGVNSNWSNITLQGRPVVSGWTLISNPFLATLDLSTTFVPGYDPVHAVWNVSGPFAGSYTDEDFIAPFQAFLVRKSSPGSSPYIINKGNLTAAPQNFQQQNNAETMTLLVENTANGLLDKTTIGFNPAATAQVDAQFDGYKMPGALTRHTLYSYNADPNEWLMRNFNASIATTSTVAVGFEPNATGNYSMHFEGLQSFDPTSYITLEDKKTGALHDVRNGNYNFTTTANDNRNRFVLHFTPKAVLNTTEASCLSNGQLTIEQPGTANWNYTIVNSNNVIISSGSLNQNSPVTVSANPGVYTITLTDANNYTVVKNVQINGESTVTATMTASATTVETGEDINFVSTTTNATSTNWNFGDGTTANTAGATHSYAGEGSYLVSLTVSNADGCSSTTSQMVTVTAKTTTGIANLNEGKLAIWSNSNRVYVDFSKLKVNEATIDIYNLLGQKVSSEKWSKSSIYSRELNNLEAGYVLVSVKTELGISTKKVFITRNK